MFAFALGPVPCTIPPVRDGRAEMASRTMKMTSEAFDTYYHMTCRRFSSDIMKDFELPMALPLPQATGTHTILLMPGTATQDIFVKRGQLLFAAATWVTERHGRASLASKIVSANMCVNWWRKASNISLSLQLKTNQPCCLDSTFAASTGTLIFTVVVMSWPLANSQYHGL